MYPERQFDEDPAEGRRQVREFVGRMRAAGFNTLMPWVRSDYIAALDGASYAGRSPTARWDALGELAREARAQGLSVHLWYSLIRHKSPGSPEFNSRAGGSEKWAVRRAGESKPRLDSFCLSDPAARAWQIQRLRKLLDRSPQASGLHLEEPAYPDVRACACTACAASPLGGGSGIEMLRGPAGDRARNESVTAMIASVREEVEKRGLVLSTNGTHSAEEDRRLGSDWVAWSRRGWLGFYVAQIYTSDAAVFLGRARVARAELPRGTRLVAGVAAEWDGGKNNPATLGRQIAAAREGGASGACIYHAQALSKEALGELNAAFWKP